MAVLLNNIAFSIKDKHAIFVQVVYHHVLIVSEVHEAVMVGAHLAKHIDNASARKGFCAEEVVLICLPYLKE